MMTEAEIAKLQRLCSLSIECHSGAFIGVNEREVDEVGLANMTATWLEVEKILDRVEKVMNHVHIVDIFPNLTEMSAMILR